MTFASIKSWLQQPTTVAGMAILVGAAATAVAHLFAATPYVTFICGLVMSALTLAGIKDNSAASKPLEKLIEDAVNGYVANRIAGVLPVLIAEGPAAIAALATPVAVTTTTTTTAPSIPVSTIGAQP